MKVTWIGHSALKLEGSKTVYIDPFITGNPKSTISLDEVNGADVVVITHDHADHLGDGFALCKKTGATLVSIHEISEAAIAEGLKSEGMNIGGTVTVDGVSVSLVPALHTAGLGGTPTGAVVELDGKKVYHAGDTGLSMEMKITGEMYEPDIAFLPIDGRYNMSPKMAAKAVEFLKVPKVVPFHYDTFPLINRSPQEFKEYVGDLSEVTILNPGESIEL